MKRKNQTKKSAAYILIALLFVFISVSLSTQIGYAEQTTSPEQVDTSQIATGFWKLTDQVDTSQIATGFWKFYKIIRNTSSIAAAVSLAFCGYHMLTGNSSDFEKYKKIAILCALAAGFIWALPSVINAAKSIGQSYEWHPESPGL